MKYFLSIISILTLFFASCADSGANGKNGGDATADSKSYASAADAANAGKEDMIAAIEQGSVHFGIDKEKLRAATPGQPVTMNTLDWDKLIKADAAATFADIISPERSTWVPLVNGNEVVTLIGIRENKEQFQVGSLGNKQVATEVNMVMASNPGARNITAFEVPNLNAIVYAVATDSNEAYYTSYNGRSLREGMSASSLVQQLQRDALEFDKRYGDKLKKGKLVK